MLLCSQWLTYKTGDYKGIDDHYGNPSPYFRKAFSLRELPTRGTLLISALGVFKAYINGQEVATDFLAPGWVDYRKQLPLVQYDITHLLREQNAIGVVLGDGWAVGHVGSNYTFKRTSWSDQIEFTATIRLEYPDGSVEEILSDGSWKATQGPIRRSDIYMGEYFDARMDLGIFSDAEYDDSAWDLAEVPEYRFTRNAYLKKVVNPPIVVKHTFEPKLIKKEGNIWLFDVSQNISGVLNCVFSGARGTKIVIRHGELLVDGKLYTENLRKAECTDTYILAGTGDEKYRPIFTFHGFRYAEITVFGTADVKQITAEVMYTDLRSTGEFSCSDEVVTKVYQNALWGQRGNFLDVPTDCPQRDERLGWTGDAQVFCKSAMYNMDCRVFYEKYLADVRDAQFGNGVVPVVAPLPHIGFRDYSGYDCTAGWAECIAEIPYFHYLMYADKKIIRDNLPALKKLVDFYETESPGYLRNYISESCYGDWLNCDAVMDLGVVSTLYYARAVYDAAALCRVVGDDEADRYQNLYEQIRKAFREAYIDPQGRILSDTQSCYLMAYSFGMIDADEARENMVRKLREDGGHLTSGFLGIKFLLPVLCELGLAADAYRILTYRDFPGWCYSVRHGATTIWEHWDSYTVENGIRPGMNSFNHYSLGSCTEWMYEYCLGIKPHFEAPGFRKVTFRPYFDPTGSISWAKGHYDTDLGRIEVDWSSQENQFTYRVTVPETIEYYFDFADMVQISHAQNGNTHVFVLER